MEYLRNLFRGKNKRSLQNVAAAFALGVILLISGNTLFANKSSEVITTAAIPQEDTAYDERLERRLEDILSRVEGAGNVRVMITLAHGRELIVAEDGKYDKTVTEETDAQGGKRTVESLNTSGTKIIVRGEDGSMTPLILKTIEPVIEGVIIVAEGGESAAVKEQLIKAAQTVLGIEPHKVQVMKSIRK